MKRRFAKRMKRKLGIGGSRGMGIEPETKFGCDAHWRRKGRKKAQRMKN